MWTSWWKTLFACFCGPYFERDFKSVYRNDAYDTPLDSYRNCATFSSLKVFQIKYSFKSILNIQDTVFEKNCIFVQFWGVIFKPLVRLMQMIYHRIAIEIAHLCYLYHFIEILSRIGAVLKITISVFQILISGGLFL